MLSLMKEGCDMVAPLNKLAMNFSNHERGGFLYILSCSNKLKEYTGKNLAALGSIFNFRKFGRC